MKSDLTQKLKITPCADFVHAINTILDEYLDELKSQKREPSERDKAAIKTIRAHAASGISGEILREDLKPILSDTYGIFWRFKSGLPNLIRVLRKNPNFKAPALRRGDSVRSPDALLQAELAKIKAEKEKLLEENQRLATALKETTSEQVTALEEKETLSDQNKALREFIKQSGLTLPSHLQPPETESKVFTGDKENAWTWKSQPSGASSPAIFKPESVSTSPLPVITSTPASSVTLTMDKT